MSENGRGEISYLEAVREALTQEMRRDPEVFLIGEDIGAYGGAFGVTRGMLMEIMFMDFLTISMNQLVNQAAKMRFMFGGKASIPMVIRTPAGSGTGAAAQHSQSLEAWFIHTPGIKVVAPATPQDVKGLLISAIRDTNPVLFMEHKLLYRTQAAVPEESYTIPLGQAQVRREGRDVTLLAYSIMVPRALEAAEELAAEGIELELIDLRSLKPLDKERIVRSVSKTGRVLILHESPQTAGFGAELAAVVAESEAFDYLDAPIRRLAGRDIPIPYNRSLERATVPQVADIVEAARDLAGEGR